LDQRPKAGGRSPEAHDLLCQPIRTAFQRAPTHSRDAVTLIVQPASQQSRRVTMTLQAKLDAFKADFEAGNPPYNVPPSVIETMHRATDELIASGAAARAQIG